MINPAKKSFLAPAFLGLLAPLAATAAEVNINDVANYTTPVVDVSIAQFSDVVPGDWAYTALQNLSESYGCVEHEYVQNLRSGLVLTRYEAAALINACLESGITSADLAGDAARLSNEFGTEMAILKGRVDGLEYKVKELSAGQFSPSTKWMGKAVFTNGALGTDGAKNGKKFATEYAYMLMAHTSFTGQDHLFVSIDQGNHNDLVLDSAMDMAMSSMTVAALYYQFPVGDFQITAGPLLDQDDVMSATTSIYSEGFRLSSMPWSQIGTQGAGAAVAWANDNGWNATSSVITTEADSANVTKGVWSKEARDTVTFAVGYDTDSYGGGLIVTDYDGADTSHAEYSTIGVGAYYRPDGYPTISVVYDTKDYASGASGTDGDKVTTHDGQKLLIGLDYDVWGGTASAAFQKDNNQGVGGDNYEFYYDYPINDGVSVKAGMFIEGNQVLAAMTDDVQGTHQGQVQDDRVGYMIETTFRF